jgi:NRPS condensation-like uncharacterized protein
MSPAIAHAQEADSLKKVWVQFSGIIVNADSIQPVPYTHIIDKTTNKGTMADYYGYFSFVAKKNDTILFSAMGYKNSEYIIPDTASFNRYSLIQVMSSDTIMLPQTVIYPWPSREQFSEAFLTLNIPDDDFERAKKNMSQAALRDIAMEMPMDGSMNFDYNMQLHQDKLYYIGQTQPITVLNPFAWAQFIEAWKDGKFKRDKK